MMMVSCAHRTQDIVILYENDVHCATEGYAVMAGLRDSMLTTTPHVAVVSAGDFAQGGVVGSLTEGRYITQIMNTVPYDAVTMGNHEFDYNLPRMHEMMGELTATTVCCNFNKIGEAPLFPGYTIRKYADTKVAFVGVATPTTHYTSTPTYFEDSLGNCLYDFHEQDTYQLVQQCTDRARKEGADYVVVLSHLGDDPSCAYSPELIARTHGIDAVLDGHAHHTFDTLLTNDCGKQVVFASTGTKFRRIGCLRISAEGEIRSQLLESKDIHVRAERTVAITDSLQGELAGLVNQVVGFAQVDLTDRDENGVRIIRQTTTNLGEFLTEAFRRTAKADIGVMNGGGVRAYIPAGDITMGHIIGVLPFNNRIWRMRCTGQQLEDALNFCLREWPLESGDYPLLSHARFTMGSNGKIALLEVQKNGTWSRVDPNAIYTVGGQSYILVSGGANGAYKALEKDGGPYCTDVESIVDFIQSGEAACFGVR